MRRGNKRMWCAQMRRRHTRTQWDNEKSMEIIAASSESPHLRTKADRENTQWCTLLFDLIKEMKSDMQQQRT